MNRVRRSLWSYGSGIAYSAISTGVALVATPLLLGWLGEERFGAYRAASDWIGYLGVFELGLGGAMLPLLARSVGKGSPTAVGSVLTTGVRAYAWAGLAMLASGAVLTIWIPRLVPVHSMHLDDLRLGCVIALGAVCFVPLAPFRLLAEAAQRGYVVHAALILQSLVITGLALVLAWRGWGITGQFLATSISTALFYCLLTGISVGADRSLLARLLGGPPDRDVQRELRKLNWPTLLHGICGRIGLASDSMVIAALIGPRLVAPFFLTQRLALLAQGQLQGVGNASWAALADLHAKGEHELFKRRLLDLTGLVATLGMGFLLPVLAYNRPFMTLWVGGSHFGGELITALAVINGFLQALFSLWGWVFCGTGKISQLLPLVVASTVVNLSASIVCTKCFGPAGPLLGTLAAFLTVQVWGMPALLYKVFGVPIRALFRAVFQPLALGLPFLPGLRWAARTLELRGWPGLLTAMAVTGGLYLLLAWLLLRGRTVRGFWREGARLMLPRTSRA